MTNEQAIDALKRLREAALNEFCGDWEDYSAFDLAIKVLKKQKNNQNAKEDVISRQTTLLDKRAEWIPVSERLPDKFTDYLITVKTDLGELYTCISRWSSFSGKQEFNAFGLPKECFINNSKYMIYQPIPEGNVIAWMPLPEQYELKSEK